MRVQPTPPQVPNTPQKVNSPLIDLLADKILDRLPIGDPFYNKLSQLYRQLKDPQDLNSPQTIKNEFLEQGISTYELHTKEDFKELISTLMKKYAMKRVQAFLFGK